MADSVPAAVVEVEADNVPGDEVFCDLAAEVVGAAGNDVPILLFVPNYYLNLQLLPLPQYRNLQIQMFRKLKVPLNLLLKLSLW